MLLIKVGITAFRSFRKATDLHLSPRTTILVGPNDHGQTNVLLAIDKLNPDRNYIAADVNHRSKETASNITYHFQTSGAELNIIANNITPLLETEDQKSLGKRAEDATMQILGQSISDTLIAIKYDQLLRDAKPEVAKAYWATPALQQLAEDLWKALDLPRRGDTTNIPLAG